MKSGSAGTGAAPGLDIVTDGLGFPEGPVAMRDGSIIVVEMRARTLTRIDPMGRHEIIAELGRGPNGAAIGSGGAVYGADNGGAWGWTEGVTHMPGPPPAVYHGGSIQRIDLATGRYTTLYDQCDGKPLNSPNANLVFGGTDMRDVWITGSSSGTQYRRRSPRPGLKLAYYA